MVKKSNHLRLLKKLDKYGKLEVYTKVGRSVPLNISCNEVLDRRRRKVRVNGSKKQSLCGWLKTRHRNKKRGRKVGSKKIKGGSQQQAKDKDVGNSLGALERLIVDRLESVGVNTNAKN